MRIIIDAHQDLAWNIKTFGRDYTRSAHQTRAHELETGSMAPKANGDTLLGWQDYQAGKVAVIFATLFNAPEKSRIGDWEAQTYKTYDEAHALYQAQLDEYHRLTDTHPDKFRLIQTLADFEDIMHAWETAPEAQPPVGLIVLMEGAEGVRDPGELEMWWRRGVRLIGPAWVGTRFCGGTREPGPLTTDGYALLDRMASFGFALDLSHMDEKAVLQALDYYEGHLAATHANAKTLLKGTDSNRFLTDRVIEGIIGRDGVIGVVPFNSFLKTGWKRGDDRNEVSLMDVVAQIDHMCQLAGDALHVGIGTDFDGGLGLQHVPHEIDTIADLQKLSPLLSTMGYTDRDIDAIFHANWQRFITQVLP